VHPSQSDTRRRARGHPLCRLLAVGDQWLHLRLCMTCGYVGCCDSSKNKHASAHARRAAHAIVESFEPGEDWFWCHVDEVAFNLQDAPTLSHASGDTEEVRRGFNQTTMVTGIEELVPPATPTTRSRLAATSKRVP
jgi:hypothetical protein